MRSFTIDAIYIIEPHPIRDFSFGKDFSSLISPVQDIKIEG